MPTIDLSPYKPNNGDVSDATAISNAFTAIQNTLNGLDNSNFVLGTPLDVGKLSTGTAGYVLTMSGGVPSWQPATAASAIPSGSITPYAGITTPSGWLLCDGSSVVRATYPDLFAALVLSKGAVSITIASPGVFTLASHGLVVGDQVYMTTTGSLPTGVVASTNYYVISAGLTANDFELSATPAGSAINLSGGQSGTHTLFLSPFGIPAASTTNFLLPDLQGRVAVGRMSTGATEVKAQGYSDFRAANARNILHRHFLPFTNDGNQAGGGGSYGGGGRAEGAGASTYGDANNTNGPAWLTLPHIIKT